MFITCFIKHILRNMSTQGLLIIYKSLKKHWLLRYKQCPNMYTERSGFRGADLRQILQNEFREMHISILYKEIIPNKLHDTPEKCNENFHKNPDLQKNKTKQNKTKQNKTKHTKNNYSFL